MAKVNQNFPYELYRFIHKPIRAQDKIEGKLFLERFTFGFQRQMEEAFGKLDKLVDLYNPALTPQPRFLKDIVGFTSELDKITNDISDADLRKLIQLAVALWKEKGLEVGYKDIIRLFTGKNSRPFNWFDYRLIVGEKAIGEEQLGEDSWLISVPGVEGSTPGGNVVLLFPFENTLKDRSIISNLVEQHGDVDFYALGPVTGSDHYLKFQGGFLSLADHVAYDFSGDLTIEGYIRTNISQDAVLFRKAFGSKIIELRYKSSTNQIIYTLSDGVTTVTETLTAAADLDDDTWRHLALVVNRTDGKARLYFGGTEATPGALLGALGDLTNDGLIYVGAKSPSVDLFQGDLDNFRVSRSAQYVITGASIPVPSVSFVQYQEEQLDEFYTDIRVVDDGNLNRTLVRRILNLMRPISERLRIIYIRAFEDFSFGKGDLTSLVLGSFIQDSDLKMPAGATEIMETTGSADWVDPVLQVRVKVESGDSFGIRFLVQDSLNYYFFKIDVTAQTATLYKVVAGVPSVIGAPQAVDIWPNSFYVLTVMTDKDTFGGTTLLKTHIDSNLIHEVNDSQFDKGTFGLESGAGSVCVVSDIEMFLMPLTYDTVKPGDNP